MKDLTLAEALPLRATITKKLSTLKDTRQRNAFVQYEKGETPQYPRQTFEQLSLDIQKTEADLRNLDVLIAKANVNTTISFEPLTMTISEAIDAAKQMRYEANDLERFSRSKPIDTRSVYMKGTNVTVYEEATFNPDDLAEKAATIKKDADRLSLLIQRANNSVFIEFSAIDDYI